jgi:pSer/pThr/pTyr-binding forkhead associated (FHA) protein
VSIGKDEIDNQAQATRPRVPEGPELASGALFGLRVLSSNRIISLVGRDNFTLGRDVDGQAVIPDVDLGRVDAYDQGVSRIHAEIRLEQDGLFVIDLDSVNGTLINGEPLQPQEPTKIHHGDLLQLGRLRLQLISRISS